MTALLDAIKRHLETDEWPFEKLPDYTALGASFQGENGSYVCVASALEDEETALFAVYAPAACPEGTRIALAELFIRFNPLINVGAFELNPDNGEMRFKGGLDVTDSELPYQLWHNLTHMACLIVDEFWPTISALIAGDIDVAEALGQIGGD